MVLLGSGGIFVRAGEALGPQQSGRSPMALRSLLLASGVSTWAAHQQCLRSRLPSAESSCGADLAGTSLLYFVPMALHVSKLPVANRR